MRLYHHAETIIEIVEEGGDASYYRQLGKYLTDEAGKGIVDLVPTSTALSVVIDSQRLDYSALDAIVRKFSFDGGPKASPSRLEIPVCYDKLLGLDLEDLSLQLGLTPEEICGAHTGASYRVEMFGFIPGFAYLSGLPSELESSRKLSPRSSVPAGAVAIAGKQTAVYPSSSPGGWQIIGQTPLKVIDFALDDPFLIKLDMSIKFIPITLQQFKAYHD